MRVLGLDIGETRVGVAVSDAEGRVALPLTVLDARALTADATPLARLVEDYEAGMLVVGVPLTLGGDEGPQAHDVRERAERLSETVGVPVAYWDERLSSAEARRAMREAGLTEREQRGALDKVAAALILQGWLDATHEAAKEDG